MKPITERISPVKQTFSVFVQVFHWICESIQQGAISGYAKKKQFTEILCTKVELEICYNPKGINPLKAHGTISSIRMARFAAARTGFSARGKAVTAFAVAFFLAPLVHAATVTWTGLDGTEWNVSGNPPWSNGTKPLAADTALFNTVLTSVTNAVADQSINSISFDTSAGTPSGSFTLGTTGGNKLLLQSGGTIQLLSTLTGTGKTISLNSPISLGGAYTFANNATSATNTLNFGGTITNSANATLTLKGTNTAINTISGLISNGTGTTSLIKNNDVSTWYLTGNNTYNGTTTANGGNLVVAGANGGIGNSAINFVGGTLTLDSSTGGFTGNRTSTIQLNGNGVALNTIGNSSANTTEYVHGNLALLLGSDMVTLTASSGYNERLAFSGTITRTAGQVGAVLFRGTNLGLNTLASQTANSTNISFITAPTMVGGIIPYALVDSTAVGLGSSLATYDTTYGIRALVAGEYVKTSTSTLAGNASVDQNFSVSSPTTVNSITMAGGNLTGAGPITLSSGAIFASNNGTISTLINLGSTEGFFNAAANQTLTVSNLQISGTSAGLNLDTNGAGTVNVTITSNGTLGHLQSVNTLTAIPVVNLTLASGITLTVGSDNSSTYYTGTINGSGNLIKTGSGTWSVGSTNVNNAYGYPGNNFSGNIEIVSGTIMGQAGQGYTLNTNSAWVTTGSMTVDSGATLQSNGSQFGMGALFGVGNLSTGNRNFVVDYNGSATDTFSGNINSSNPNANVYKSGTGTLALTGNNTAFYGFFSSTWGTLQTPGLTGNSSFLTIGGTLKVTGTSGLVTGAGYNLGGTANGNTLAGGTLWIAPTGSGAAVMVTGMNYNGSGAGTIRFNAASGRLLLDRGANTSLTYSIGGPTAATASYINVQAGMIIAAAHGLSELGVTEKFNILTGMTLPTNTNGIVNSAIIGQDASGTTLNGDFLTYTGTGSSSDAGFTPFNYASGDINFAAAGVTKVEKVTSGASLGNSTTVFALRDDGQAISIAAGKTLTIGDSSLIGATSLPGLIMNGGSITGGTLNFSANSTNTVSIAASIYTSGTAAISSNITTSVNGGIVIQGPGVLTYTGAAIARNLYLNSGATFESSNSSLTGLLILNGGVFQSNGSLNRVLGGAAGQVAWGYLTAGLQNGPGGGFAAKGGTLTVNLNVNSVAGGTVVWNTGDTTLTGYNANSLLDYQTLIFGSATADSEVNFVNPLNLGGNTAYFSRVIDVIDNASSQTDQVRFSGGISSFSASNGITKDGAGRLILSGTNTYKGATFVSAGALLVDGSLTATSLVQVRSGATIGGSGSINSAAPISVDSGGFVSPGSVDASGNHSTGILSVGALSMASGTQLLMTINGSTAGSGYDQLNASGGVTLAATGTELHLTLTYNPPSDGSQTYFDLIVSGSQLPQQFGSIYLNGTLMTIASNLFNFTYNSTDYVGTMSYTGTPSSLTGGVDVVLRVGVAPEPTTWALLGLSLIMVVVRHRLAGPAESHQYLSSLARSFRNAGS